MSEDDDVTSNRAVRQMEERIRELERQLGRKTPEVEIKTRSKNGCGSRSRSRRMFSMKVVAVMATCRH